jgi:hypothetical protein
MDRQIKKKTEFTSIVKKLIECFFDYPFSKEETNRRKRIMQTKANSTGHGMAYW